MWFAMGGGERLLDATEVVALDATRDGCKVQWTEWDKIPHSWVLMCMNWWQAAKAMILWARACTELVERGKYSIGSSNFVHVDERETKVDIEGLTSLTRSDMMSGMQSKAEVMKIWTGGKKISRVTKSQL